MTDSQPTLASMGLHVDALPYIDDGYEAMQPAVQAMLADELRRFLPRNYLQHLPAPNVELSTEALQEAYGRAQSKTRIVLESRPDMVSAPKRPEPSAWQAAVEAGQASLEQQQLRLVNLELADAYAARAWRTHNEQLEAVVKQLEHQLASVRQQIEQLNVQRKQQQVDSGVKLQSLNDQYRHLLSSNAEIEAAIAALL